jgi:hypothetical protein
VSRNPDRPESNYGEALAGFRDLLNGATTLDGLREASAALRRVEVEVEERRLRLILDARPQHAEEADEPLDSRRTAKFLGTSLDWIYRNRPRLAPALVSPHDARQRYSRQELQQLRDTWSKTDWRKK